MPQSDNAVFTLRNYDLVATLTSGQAFRWREVNGAWENIVAGRWVRLSVKAKKLHAQTHKPQVDWKWLRDYLQLDIDFKKILAAFPKDDPNLDAAKKTCRGLRLLKQDPWETLAGFICSSNKQIVQIQQIIAALCNRLGKPAPNNWRTFPTAARLAAATEDDLRACRMGYRAKYLHRSAQMIATNQLDLAALQSLDYETAKTEIQRLPGIGPKVADCILLFAYGFPEAFPIDTWVLKALHQLYFPSRRPTTKRLQTFIKTHFAPHHGYAQQYLFHHVRTQGGLELKRKPKPPPNF